MCGMRLSVEESVGMTAAHICRGKHFPKEDTMRSISCEIILAQVSVWGPLLMEIILKNHSCISEKKERVEQSTVTSQRRR